MPKRTSCSKLVCDVICPTLLLIYDEFPVSSRDRLKCLPLLSDFKTTLLLSEPSVDQPPVKISFCDVVYPTKPFS